MPSKDERQQLQKLFACNLCWVLTYTVHHNGTGSGFCFAAHCRPSILFRNYRSWTFCGSTHQAELTRRVDDMVDTALVLPDRQHPVQPYFPNPIGLPMAFLHWNYLSVFSAKTTVLDGTRPRNICRCAIIFAAWDTTYHTHGFILDRHVFGSNCDYRGSDHPPPDI